MKVSIHFNGTKKQLVEVADLAEAVAKFKAFRDGGNPAGEYFGASDQRSDCGDIWDDGKRIAHISYNGRLWQADRHTPLAA